MTTKKAFLHSFLSAIRGVFFSKTEESTPADDDSALQEARKIAHDPKIKGYTDVEEALRALKS